VSWSNLSGRVRARVRQVVLTRDGHRCQLQLDGCTRIATTVDHVRPREVAGDGPDNLVAACAWCNGSKGRPGRHDPDPTPRSSW
jgi:5-methylcytosine-specific restriction endonuclease McrA